MKITSTIKMSRDEFDEIFENEDTDWDGCNALQGLNIINKYLHGIGIEGAGHDVIYSAGVDALIEAGISKEDAGTLRKLNWMIEGGDYMACFV